MGVAEGAPRSILPNEMGRAEFRGQNTVLASSLIGLGNIQLLSLENVSHLYLPPDQYMNLRSCSWGPGGM